MVDSTGMDAVAPLHLLLVLEATEGGTRRHVRELSLEMLRRGFRVSLAVSTGRDPDFGRQDIPLLRDAGADVLVLPMQRGIAPFRDMACVRRLRAWMRRHRPDLVHTHSSKAGVLGRHAAACEGIPAIHTPHGFAFEMRVPSPLRAFYRAIERRMAGHTALLIAVSEAEARLARGLSPDLRVEVVHNGIPPSSAPPAPLPSRRFDAAFIGRFGPQKAPEVFLEACGKVLAARPGARFAMMGSGDPGIAARRLLRADPALEAATSFFPRSGDCSADALLRDTKTLAMPSRWEGFPYLVLEAMAAGTPLVAADVGGVREAVRNGCEALLVPPDSPPLLARSILRLLDDTPLACRLAGAARERVGRFTLEAMADRTASLYRDVRRTDESD
ncbi:MAG: glycosyltransferase [Kiritimatiellia bacterium]|jgi:glycosyltransferase involved in cell wall biosynthesis